MANQKKKTGKKKTLSAKGENRSRATTSGNAASLEKASSVISRRNQNGTVILMRMDRASLFYKLDGIAAEVWGCFTSPRDVGAMTEFFAKRYPAAARTLTGEIQELLDKCIGLELLAPSKGPCSSEFPADPRPDRTAKFGGIQEFDLEQIESEVLNESIYLDVFAGSDLRLKKDVAPISGALAKVVQLDGITHAWDPERVRPRGPFNPRARRAGLIAQQVAEHMPELVRADRRTGLLAVEYQKLNSYLVEAIKELDYRTRSQAEQIRRLELKNRTKTGQARKRA